jgi:hypothetical protein
MKKLIYWNEEKTDNAKMKKEEDKSAHKTLQHNYLWWECNGNRK